jgi:hypothetical protein
LSNLENKYLYTQTWQWYKLVLKRKTVNDPVKRWANGLKVFKGRSPNGQKKKHEEMITIPGHK